MNQVRKCALPIFLFWWYLWLASHAGMQWALFVRGKRKSAELEGKSGGREKKKKKEEAEKKQLTLISSEAPFQYPHLKSC